MVWVKSFVIGLLIVAIFYVLGTYVPMVVFKWLGLAIMMVGLTFGVRYFMFK